jgi:CheY-like chemotaxis protein
MNSILLYCMHPEDRDRMARLLADSDYSLLACSTLYEFETLLNARAPILSILDYKLPEGDSLQLIRNLREDPKTRYFSYVVKIDPAEAPLEEDTAQGINDFLLVPFSDVEFMRMVERLSNVKRRRFFQALIRVYKGEDFVMGKTINLSPTGTLLQAPITLAPGDDVDVSFYLPHTRVLVRTRAVVKRRASEHIAVIPCYGLEFVDLPSEFAHELEGFVRQEMKR